MNPPFLSAMQPRPFYRGISFWCIIAILVFMVWITIRSFSVSDQVSWKGSSGIWTISQHTGQMILTHINTSDWYFPEGLSFAQIEGPVADAWFPPAMKLASFPVSATAKGTNYHVAHWFVAALFILLWICSTIRRHHRFAKGLTGQQEEPGIPDQAAASNCSPTPNLKPESPVRGAED
jgi:hypothetical protein